MTSKATRKLEMGKQVITMSKVTFNNVTITVEAESAMEAYRLLGGRLGDAPFAYQSDTYSDATHDDRDTGYIGKELNEDGEDELAIFIGTL
jgi:hypothetical protein